MSTKIKLRFPETGRLLKKFLDSIAQGRLSIPLSKKCEPGEELDLEVFLPELPGPQKLLVKVEAQSADGKSVETRIVNREEIEALLDRLWELPAYRELLEGTAPRRIEIEEVEEQVSREEPEKGAEPETVIDLGEPIPEPGSKVSAAKPAVPGADKPSARKQPGTREDVRAPQQKPEPSESVKKPVESQVKIKIKAPVESASAPASAGDPLSQLRKWVVKKEERKEKKEDKIKVPERKVVDFSVDRREDLSDFAPVGKFAQSLVKAMLRSGYYSPEHPGASQAKAGLFSEFKQAVGENDELGFMLQHRVGQETEFLILGVSEEPITLKKLLGVGTADLFVPKYMDYFERKRLINLAVKSSISEDHFYRFVDIMSDPAVDKGEARESGRLLTRLLVDNKIPEISAIFEDDLIVMESKLPWRVEMAIQRLAKDLKVLPMFKDVSPEEMRQLKAQIVQDILRPLRQPELLKDIVLNIYLIARQVPGIVEAELEEAVIQNFPMNMLIPVSEFIFREMSRLQELKPEGDAQKHALDSRMEAAKRILKKIASFVVMEEIEGADNFLEQLFSHGIMTFEELPPEVQQKVYLKNMAVEFQKQPYVWIGKFLEARSGEDLELLVNYFNRILPLLLERKDWQSLYLITECISKVPEKKRTLLAERGIPDLHEAIWGEKVPELVRVLLEEALDMRKGVEEIFVLLGEFGLQKLYNSLLEEKDSAKRKLLIEGLIKFGPKSIERLRGILKDPARPANLQILALEAIGRTKNKPDAELIRPFLKHSRPELRAEAISSLVRVLEMEAAGPVEQLLSDPDLGVKKRAVAALGFFAKNKPELKAKLRALAFGEEAELELRAQALQELGRNPPEGEEERKTLQERLLDLLFEGEGFGHRMRKRFSGSSDQGDKHKIAALVLLGKIGDRDALEGLSRFKLAGKELASKQDEVLNQLRLRLGAQGPDGGD